MKLKHLCLVTLCLSVAACGVIKRFAENPFQVNAPAALAASRINDALTRCFQQQTTMTSLAGRYHITDQSGGFGQFHGMNLDIYPAATGASVQVTAYPISRKLVDQLRTWSADGPPC
jgi:hypothetical protein